MSVTNPFDGTGGNLSGFATDVVPITPNDSADLPGGTAIAIAAGEVLPVGISRVIATGTTSTNLFAHHA